MIEKLKEAGLTENESKIYLSLLDNGPSLAGLISKKTGIHRRTIYDSIERLIEKGLVGYILKNNRRWFQASNPDKLLKILQEKQENIQEIIPLMQEKFLVTKKKEETIFYKGKEGLKSIFEEQLDYKEILILGASPRAYEILQFYFKLYDKKRKKSKIKSRIIAQDKKISNLPLAEIRYLPKKYANPVALNIYGNKIAIILWAKNPLAIVINQKEIADAYRGYFELMWKIAKC